MQIIVLQSSKILDDRFQAHALMVTDSCQIVRAYVSLNIFRFEYGRHLVQFYQLHFRDIKSPHVHPSFTDFCF